MDLGFLQIALLAGAAFFAGTVDAIAGGGGLVTLPALLAIGLPPHLALGTNKGQSVFGSGAAMLRFWHAGLLDRARALLGFVLGLAGSLLGAQLVLRVRPDILRPVVLVLLPLVALVVMLRPRELAALTPRTRRDPRGLVAVIAFGIALYDGFFGPGTGTFLILAFVGLLGLTPTQASAEAKVVNFASNVAAVALFSAKGVVVWKVAAPMAVAQLAGGVLGAHLTLRRGDRLVRWAVALVVAALVVKLGYDVLAGR